MAYSVRLRWYSLPEFLTFCAGSVLKRLPLVACWLCVTLLVSAFSSPLVAAETQPITTSSGLVLHLPEAWQLLDKQDLSSVERGGDEQLDLPPMMRQRLAARLSQGDLELLLNTRDSHEGVYDNLSLFETNDQVPEAASQIRATCGALPSLLSRTLGKEVTLQRCEGQEVAGYPSFVIAYAGNVPATQVLQYMLQVEQRRSLVLTLTYHQDDAFESLSDFNRMLDQLEVITQ